MGHYLVGRWCSIRSTAFSVGFGPELIGFTDKRGTRWKISAIPLGGYVKFFGDDDVASMPDAKSVSHMTEADKAHTLAGAKLWKRAATVAAGPIANFILAIAIFAVLFSVYGKVIADPVVAEVRPDSAAAEAGVQTGTVWSRSMAVASRLSTTSAAMSACVRKPRSPSPLNATGRTSTCLWCQSAVRSPTSSATRSSSA